MIKLSNLIEQLQSIHAQHGDGVEMMIGLRTTRTTADGYPVIQNFVLEGAHVYDFNEESPPSNRKIVSLLSC